MEEKQRMTNKEMESQIASLRSQKLIFTILTYGSAIGMFAMFEIGKIPIAVILLVIMLFSASKLADAGSALKQLFSEQIISSVIKEALGDDVEYNPWGKINPGSMVFPFSYNTTNGSDHIKAIYKGLNIELGDSELLDASKDITENGQTVESRYTHFKGQWLICDFGKELAGQVYISEWSKKDHGRMKSNVTMDNEQFNKRFCVRADDPQEAYYILTPHMMEYIISIADKSGGPVYMSFLREGKLHIAVQTGHDFFELGKDKADVGKLRQKFLGELHWFTDIIDTLRVEDTLYKKETNV